MRYLTIEEVLLLHFKIIEDYGGSHGVRDEGRVQSFCEAPKQQIFGQDQYSTVYEKAAVYLRNIVADHPFVDGNKRTAITVATIFLTRQNCHLSATPKELEDFAVQVAVEHLEITVIADWLQAHC
jgi:death on curing protein